MTGVKTLPLTTAQSTREDPHLGVLLARARRALVVEILARFAEAGFNDLREAHDPVFAFLPPGGARLTELARRARITKQSMGELLRELEALGYVERAIDPSDRRARLVTFTTRGQRANEIGIETIRETERSWAERVGADHVRAMRETLEQVTRAGS
jgi:DNA-binding MarR family transcriptional regulator